MLAAPPEKHQRLLETARRLPEILRSSGRGTRAVCWWVDGWLLYRKKVKMKKGLADYGWKGRLFANNASKNLTLWCNKNRSNNLRIVQLWRWILGPRPSFGGFGRALRLPGAGVAWMADVSVVRSGRGVLGRGERRVGAPWHVFWLGRCFGGQVCLFFYRFSELYHMVSFTARVKLRRSRCHLDTKNYWVSSAKTIKQCQFVAACLARICIVMTMTMMMRW